MGVQVMARNKKAVSKSEFMSDTEMAWLGFEYQRMDQHDFLTCGSGKL